MKQYYRRNPAMRAKMSRLLQELHREYGWRSRLAAAIGGPYVLWKAHQEEKRLVEGRRHEPPTFYEQKCVGETICSSADGGRHPRENCKVLLWQEK
jgi:hypothetical protein